MIARGGWQSVCDELTADRSATVLGTSDQIEATTHGRNSNTSSPHAPEIIEPRFFITTRCFCWPQSRGYGTNLKAHRARSIRARHCSTESDAYSSSTSDNTTFHR